MANHDWFEFSYVGLLLSLETVDRAPPPWANNLTYSASSHALKNVYLHNSTAMRVKSSSSSEVQSRPRIYKYCRWGMESPKNNLVAKSQCNLYCHFRMHKLLLIQSTRTKEQPTTNNISAERRTECKSIAFRARRLFFFFAAAATSSSTLSSTRLEIYLFCVTFYPTCARTLTLHSLAKCNL